MGAVPQARLARERHARDRRSPAAACRLRTCSASAAAASREFLDDLDDGRVAFAALAVGLVAAASSERGVREGREAFGRPIGAFQAIQFKIADMTRRRGDRAARRPAGGVAPRHGAASRREASVAKLDASEAAVASAREAVQIHGGYGYIEEFPVARFYRDAKVLEIGEGTSEIQRILIARSHGLPATEL